MGNFINGYSKPRFIIQQLDNVQVAVYDFPFCNLSGGLQTNYSETFKRHTLQNYNTIDFDFQGAQLSFALDYSTYLTKPSYFDIEAIIKFHRLPEQYKIILIPRIDVLAQQFEVRFAGNNILSLGIHSNGEHAIGNKLTTLKFITKDVYTGNLFFNPDDLNRPLPFNLK